MNLSHNHELSLYRTAQQLTSIPQGESAHQEASPWVTSFSYFQGLIQSLINFCRDQKLQATLWIKLPADGTWTTEIEQYYQQGLASQIYYCSVSDRQGRTYSDGVFSRSSTKIKGINHIVLEATSQLQREYFFLLLSPQICCLVVVQEITQTNKDDSKTDKPIKLILSFVPEVIDRVLQQLKQMVTITDNTPEDLTADAVLTFPFPNQIQSNLLTSLFQHQLQQRVKTPVPKLPTTAIAPKLKPVHELLGTDDEFLMNMTQELGVPLTNMKTALSLLDSMQNKREQRQRYLDLLKRECDRQNLLITGLQEFIQLNYPLDETDKTVRLEDSVPGIVSTYQAIAEEKGISLGYTIPSGFPPVNCPNSWLRLILHHLLHNSLKFTQAKGRVYVQSALKRQAIELVISDTGVGIDSSDIPHLFESFYRGRNATHPELAGAGLGLAIVKQLVQRCGASITVNSYLGKGTTFRILFPVALA